jgi:hypothetical protein
MPRAAAVLSCFGAGLAFSALAFFDAAGAVAGAWAAGGLAEGAFDAGGIVGACAQTGAATAISAANATPLKRRFMFDLQMGWAGQQSRSVPVR